MMKMSTIHKIECIIVLFALVLISLPVSPINVAGVPNPYFFSGSLSIDGVLAPVGTVVTAEVNGVVVSNIITTSDVGSYGNKGYLIVQSNDDMNVSTDSEVHFFADGYECNQTQVIQSDVRNPDHLYHLNLTANTTVISGSVYEVRGMTLPQGPYHPIAGATIKFVKDGVVKATGTSDEQGNFSKPVPGLGTYSVTAAKAGFGDEEQPITITTLRQECTCNFKSTYGLIPNAPDIWYLLDCAALWKYTPASDPELGLDIWRLLDVAAAWKSPIL